MATTTDKNTLVYKSLRDSKTVSLSSGNGKRDIVLNGKTYRLPSGWHLHVRGLKPNTMYKAFHGNKDVTQYLDLEEGRAYGSGSSTTVKTDRKGRLYFEYYYGAWFGYDTENAISRLQSGNESIYFVPASSISRGFVPVSNTGYVTTPNPSVTTEKKPVPQVAKAVVQTAKNYPTYILQNTEYDFIQTFYVDPNSVGNAKTINLLDVKLFFKNKPSRTNNKSGVVEPSVTIHIIDVENNLPVVTRTYKDGDVEKDYDDVFASSDASIPTTFAFSTPVQLDTGKFYGIAIVLEDDDYQLWYARQGDRVIGTNNPSGGASKTHRGDLFQRANMGTTYQSTQNQASFKSLTDTDLKFSIDVAKYSANSVTIDLVNRDYEFMAINTVSGTFWGGEWAYQEEANATGTISITQGNTKVTGVGTTFEANTDLVSEHDWIVVTDGTPGNTRVVEIEQIASNTEMYLSMALPFTISGGAYIITPCARIHYYDALSENIILDDSTATAFKPFTANSTLIGTKSGASCVIESINDYPIGSFISDIDFNTPSLTTATATYNFANSGYYTQTTDEKVDLYLPNHVNKYDGLIMSRTNEVLNTTNLYGNSEIGYKSSIMKMTFVHKAPTTALYETPIIRGEGLTLVTAGWLINNDATNEHTNQGNAVTKHISSKLSFQEGKFAEDIRVITNAYRPVGTDVKIYAKIHHSSDPEAFDDKNWTELEMISGEGKFSASDNREDIVEYEYGFPDFIPVDTVLPGSAVTQEGNTTVIGTGTNWNTTLANGDIIQIYSPLFAENQWTISVEEVVSDTEITISEPVPNASMAGDMKIATVLYPQTAYNNVQNSNVVRYYNAAGAQYDTYNTVAIKTVLLSENTYLVPTVDDTRVIGVSA